MSQELESLLCDYGDFVKEHLDWPDRYGENILYRAGIMGGRVQVQGDGHKILCPDMPRRLQKVDIALKRIPTIPSLVVRVFYCAPLNGDKNYTKGQLASLNGDKNYTKGQLASLTRMSLTAFDTNLSKGKRLLKKEIWK